MGRVCSPVCCVAVQDSGGLKKKEVHGEPGQVLSATPAGFAEGLSLAIPVSRAGAQENVQAAVGWALGLCGVSGDTNRGLSPGDTCSPRSACQEFHTQVDAAAHE